MCGGDRRSRLVGSTPSQTVLSAAGRAGVGGPPWCIGRGLARASAFVVEHGPTDRCSEDWAGTGETVSVVLTSYFYVQLWVRFLRRFDSRPSLPLSDSAMHGPCDMLSP